MKVFISWSGEKSRKLGELLRDWLPAVVQAVKPYFSPNDIDKGARWGNEISKELEQSRVGVLCLTPSNLQAPWLMFEAGALAKSIEKSRVVPLLFGVDATELQGPLLQFQAASFKKEEIAKLLKTINGALEGDSLENTVLESVFEKWWPELEEKVNAVLSAEYPEHETGARSDRAIIEEILELTRASYYETNRQNSSEIDPIFLDSVEKLSLAPGTLEPLKSSEILLVGDLVHRTEIDLLVLQNFGKRNLTEIKDVLATRGLSLGMRIDGWPVGRLRDTRRKQR